MYSLLLSELSGSHEYQVKLDWRAISIYIYGTGSFAQDIKKELGEHGVNILGFIDHRAGKMKKIEGVHVKSPDDPGIDPEQRRNAIVILGIHNREVYIPTILQRLKQLGYERVISSVDLYDQFAEGLSDRYWLTSRIYYSSYIPEIEQVYGMLSDEVSRETFVALLRFRITGNYSLLPKPDIEHQYFPPDLPALFQPVRLADCGAYDGDTLQSFVRAGYEFQSIAAFEPDQYNFHRLSAYVARNPEKFPNTSLFPCGVYSSTTQLKFEVGRGEGSVASKSGSKITQCISLDECLPTFQPTLIKMDIEGAEMDAILGAKQLIKTYKPALAISVYHTPAHIWEIPLCINQIAEVNNIRYTYHLRAHAQNCFDSIFYAIPERSTR